MTRTLSTDEAREQLIRLLDDARRGESVIIEKDGQPAAALVPVEILSRHLQNRHQLAEAIRKFRESVQTDLSTPELEALIDREVEAVRARRYEQELKPASEA